MRDSVFNLHQEAVKLPKYGDELIIYPVGDIHRETPLCDTDRWKQFVSKCRKEIAEGKNVYFVGLGDWNDFAAWGDRKKIRNASLHESTIMELDASAKRHCDALVKELEFTKGRWLGLVQGNHRWEFTYIDGYEGKSSDDYYADKLGTVNLGDAAYLRTRLSAGKNNTSLSIDMLLHHGKAGGKLAGTTINQMEDLMKVFPSCDMYISGHDHRKVAVPISTLWVENGSKNGLKLKQKRQWLMRSGSFLRGYVDGESSYIVGKMLRPTDLGIVKIHVRIRRDRSAINGVKNDNAMVDIHVEY